MPTQIGPVPAHGCGVESHDSPRLHHAMDLVAHHFMMHGDDAPWDKWETDHPTNPKGDLEMCAIFTVRGPEAIAKVAEYLKLTYPKTKGRVQ